MTDLATTTTAPDGPAVNGHPPAPTPATFPVDSFKEAAPHLRRPFTAAAVKFKVQTVAGDRVMVVSYIDARLVVERINLVCPHLWTDETYEPVSGGKGLLCSLTIDGLTHRDVGSDYIGKGLYSDALKRAAVKFGIGVSLYATPQRWLAATMFRTDSKGKPVIYAGDNVESELRSQYQAWLTEVGIPAFGEPLDHGDVEGAAGDVEADAAHAAVEAPQPPAEPERPGAVTAGEADRLARRAKEVWGDQGATMLRQHIAGLTGQDPGDVATLGRAKSAIRALGLDVAAQLEVIVEADQVGGPA